MEAIKGKGESTKSRAETIKKAFEQPNPKALEATLASNLAGLRFPAQEMEMRHVCVCSAASGIGI